MHRTGCGCVECGPPRRDPVTFEWPEELDEVLTYEGVRLVVSQVSERVADGVDVLGELFDGTLARITRGDVP